MRSRTGCLTCRSRKLKCDEQKPTCGQCAKAKRPCRPCDSVVFRHQQNASLNSADARNLNSFYAYKDTFDDDSVWLDIPRAVNRSAIAVTFVNVRDPYALSSSPELDEDPDEDLVSLGDQETGNPGAEHTRYTPTDQTSTSGLEALSAAALHIPSEAGVAQDSVPFTREDLENLQSPPMENGVSPQMDASLAPPSGNLEYILNPASTVPQPIHPNLESLEGEYDMTTDYRRLPKARMSQAKASTETSHNSAFLMRHFSEATGKWYVEDPLKKTTFFSSHIPVKSISNPLLKHAACAYAAKQLARVNGTKAIAGGSCSQQATMEVWENAAQEDWTVLSAQHYDQAISLLMDALNWDHGSAEANSSEEIDKRHYAPRTVEGMVAERKLRRRQFESAQSTARSDDLLAATAILCEYESLDASTAAWTRHLSGTKSLLDVVEVGMMPLDTVTTSETVLITRRLRKPSQARRAIFWNFARQDLFAAFVNECRTRLDTEDVPMWRDAGLLLDDNNLVVPSNTADLGLPEEDLMREDMMGNAWIWLMSKLMNLICTSVGEAANPRSARLGNPHAMSPEVDSRQQSLSEKWNRLDHEMETWYNGLPETFMPSAIISVRPYGADLTEGQCLSEYAIRDYISQPSDPGIVPGSTGSVGPNPCSTAAVCGWAMPYRYSGEKGGSGLTERD
ncbi:MAG: hypothetical protein Q9181_005398 [Wetmoreana brouardii]